MDLIHKVYEDHDPLAKQEGRFQCGFESPSDMEEHDDVQIRINGGKLGASVSLSYLQSIPKSEDGTRSSYGTQGHPDKCIPCCFFSRAKGCADGVLCNMCHGAHPQQGYSRRKKERLKKAREKTPANPIGLQEHVPSPDTRSSERSPSQGEVWHVIIKNTFLEVCILPPTNNCAFVRSQSAP